MYIPASDRYDSAPGKVPLRRLGSSGLLVPTVSLGLWQNFGSSSDIDTQRAIITGAFDRGITHFDLANNYGPPAGSAEENFGKILGTSLSPYRDELLLSTKAGYRQLPGPYGEGGSRKYLLSSLDASLKRLGTDYVDIFYSHRYDPTTPLYETLGALKSAVDSGKALYAGISSYSATRTAEAIEVAAEIGLRIAVHQPSLSLLNRWIQNADTSGSSVVEVCEANGLGIIAFSPLAQGLLTEKYLSGSVPSDSRAALNASFKQDYLNPKNVATLHALNEFAKGREQSLAQLAISWAVTQKGVTSVILGARTLQQLDENLAALNAPRLTESEISSINSIAIDGNINLWASRSSDL